MHVAITGSSGLVGSALQKQLSGGDYRIARMVRREATGDNEIRWDPNGEKTDTAALDGVDGVVHLAGENIAAGRWTEKLKQKIRDSRVPPTRKLCEDLAHLEKKPSVLVCASAIGYYGEAGDTILDESSPAGEGFLSETVKEWEAATQPAIDAGIRVVNLRIGVILSPDGGALKQMLTPFKLGVGGRVGSGKQYWSWVALDDIVGAIEFALTHDELSGPVNGTSPNPVTNTEFTKVLGKVLGRPTIFPMPAFAARLALGEMADELLLTSSRIVPKKLEAAGYQFQYPDLEMALRHLLNKPASDAA